MVIATIWSFSQIRFFHQRLDAIMKIMPGVTDIADDVPSKGDSEMNHDIAVFSLLETAQQDNLKFKHDKIQSR